jgi:hypothetical protein
LLSYGIAKFGNLFSYFFILLNFFFKFGKAHSQAIDINGLVAGKPNLKKKFKKKYKRFFKISLLFYFKKI